MRFSHSVTIPLDSGITAGKLQDALKTIPADATLSVQIVRGDRPWESDSHSIRATWYTGN